VPQHISLKLHSLKARPWTLGAEKGVGRGGRGAIAVLRLKKWVNKDDKDSRQRERENRRDYIYIYIYI
jgi:hypothetical protein